MHEETALAVVEPRHEALAIERAPDVVLDEARRAAVALSTVIEGKKKKVVFNGETYLENEDWLTVARFYGVTSRVRSAKYIEFGDGEDKVKGFEAVAEAYLVGSDQIISTAESMCLNDEPNWNRKPLFQLKSMAQTRASSRVLRQVFGWVVVLAGYKPTPAEEMNGESNGTIVQPPRRKTAIPSNGHAAAEVSPDTITALFDEEPPAKPMVTQAAMDVCPDCGSTRIQPAGISKQGRAYKAFCKDCADAKKAAR